MTKYETVTIFDMELGGEIADLQGHTVYHIGKLTHINWPDATGEVTASCNIWICNIDVNSQLHFCVLCVWKGRLERVRLKEKDIGKRGSIKI